MIYFSIGFGIIFKKQVKCKYEQEKLLEAINVLKYNENGLDRILRLAREDEAKKVTEQVTEQITEQITEQVTEQITEQITEQVTEQITERVTEQVTEKLACNLLRADNDVNFIHEMTGLPISRIDELKANL